MPYPVLAVNDDPKIGESLMGFALRMSEANHFMGMQWLANIFGVKRIYHLSSHHMPTIAWIFGSCPTRFNEMTADLRQFKGESHTHAYGHVITRSFLLRIRQPQICPACLAESGYIKKIWDFSLVTCCPQHGTVLAELCTECGKKLSWRRPGVSTCDCGFDLRRLKSIQSHESALCFASWFSRRLPSTMDASCENSYGSAALTLLDCLSTDGAMRLLWAIGINATAKNVVSVGETRKALSTFAAGQCIARGVGRFLEICLQQNLATLRPTFVTSALQALAIDGMCDADRSLAAQLITYDKQRENPKASLLHCHPLSQMKLF